MARAVEPADSSLQGPTPQFSIQFSESIKASSRQAGSTLPCYPHCPRVGRHMVDSVLFQEGISRCALLDSTEWNRMPRRQASSRRLHLHGGHRDMPGARLQAKLGAAPVASLGVPADLVVRTHSSPLRDGTCEATRLVTAGRRGVKWTPSAVRFWLSILASVRFVRKVLCDG